MPQSQLIYFVCPSNELFRNSRLPVIYYKRGLLLPAYFRKYSARNIFIRHGWSATTGKTIPSLGFCHSENHIAIIALKGETVLQLGGNHGQRICIAKDDSVIIPAGVVYQSIARKEKGSYLTAQPDGTKLDIHIPVSAQRPDYDHIATLPIPPNDPLYGLSGALSTLWTPFIYQMNPAACGMS